MVMKNENFIATFTKHTHINNIHVLIIYYILLLMVSVSFTSSGSFLHLHKYTVFRLSCFQAYSKKLIYNKLHKASEIIFTEADYISSLIPFNV